jgi:salicylate hydroxylase
MEQPQGSQFRRDFHVCIVGAGIVGLAGAILLRRHGFHVTVLERDETLRTVITPVCLSPVECVY